VLPKRRQAKMCYRPHSGNPMPLGATRSWPLYLWLIAWRKHICRQASHQ